MTQLARFRKFAALKPAASPQTPDSAQPLPESPLRAIDAQIAQVGRESLPYPSKPHPHSLFCQTCGLKDGENHVVIAPSKTTGQSTVWICQFCFFDEIGDSRAEGRPLPDGKRRLPKKTIAAK